jgi:hypothetical protein
LCKKDYETEEEARAQQRVVEPLMNELMAQEHGHNTYLSKGRGVTNILRYLIRPV